MAHLVSVFDVRLRLRRDPRNDMAVAEDLQIDHASGR